MGGPVVDGTRKRHPTRQRDGIPVIERLLRVFEPKHPGIFVRHLNQSVGPGLLEILPLVDHQCVECASKLWAQLSEILSQRIEDSLGIEINVGATRLADHNAGELMKSHDHGRIGRYTLHGIGQWSVVANVECGLACGVRFPQRLKRELGLARAGCTLNA